MIHKLSAAAPEPSDPTVLRSLEDGRTKARPYTSFSEYDFVGLGLRALSDRRASLRFAPLR